MKSDKHKHVTIIIIIIIRIICRSMCIYICILTNGVYIYNTNISKNSLQPPKPPTSKSCVSTTSILPPPTLGPSRGLGRPDVEFRWRSSGEGLEEGEKMGGINAWRPKCFDVSFFPKILSWSKWRFIGYQAKKKSEATQSCCKLAVWNVSTWTLIFTSSN